MKFARVLDPMAGTISSAEYVESRVEDARPPGAVYVQDLTEMKLIFDTWEWLPRLSV